MPRVSTKKPRVKKGQGDLPLPETAVATIEAPATAVAVEEPPPVEESRPVERESRPVESAELRPPTTPIETQEAERTDRPVRTEKRGGVSDKDRIAASLKIAKLQAMAVAKVQPVP